MKLKTFRNLSKKLKKNLESCQKKLNTFRILLKKAEHFSHTVQKLKHFVHINEKTFKICFSSKKKETILASYQNKSSQFFFQN